MQFPTNADRQDDGVADGDDAKGDGGDVADGGGGD